MNLKTPLIVLLSLGVLALCFAAVIYILNNYDDSEDPNTINKDNKIEIIDGDTFKTADGEIIRLLCVDTPEQGKVGFKEAGDYLSSLILSKDIQIERLGFDVYNRTLAWISLDINGENVLVNKAIIDNGYGALLEYDDANCEKVK